MICKKCGCRVSDTAAFCDKCGASMAEFGIKEEKPQKKENAVVKSGKLFIKKVKENRKLQIVLVVAIALLLAVVIIGRIVSKHNIFGISPNMNVSQIISALGGESEIEIDDSDHNNGAKIIEKENVKWQGYNGTLSVLAGDEDFQTFVKWSMSEDETISEPVLMKLLERNYGKNQLEPREDSELPDTNPYISDFGAWSVSVNASVSNLFDVPEYSELTIWWLEQEEQ